MRCHRSRAPLDLLKGQECSLMNFSQSLMKANLHPGQGLAACSFSCTSVCGYRLGVWGWRVCQRAHARVCVCESIRKQMDRVNNFITSEHREQNHPATWSLNALFSSSFFFSFKAWISLPCSQCAQATHSEVVLEMNLLVLDLPLCAST